MSSNPAIDFDASKGEHFLPGLPIDFDLSQGTYKLERDSTEPDPSIIELNSELGKCDEVTSSSLAAREHQLALLSLKLKQYLIVL